MNFSVIKRYLLMGAAAAAGTAVLPAEVRACGGFFCSQSAPVNQAAERIIFADNGDGTVTAVIQIMYEGPAESFSWLLPISTVPQEGDIGIASDIAFQRLQVATNPQYNLTTRVEGTCKDDSVASSNDRSAGNGTGGASAGGPAEGGVTVEASGVVGAFEWSVISLNESLTDPSEAAVRWLTDNGYDVAEGARGLIRPYLEDGLNLLALRLTKGADAGSIRPIKLTYAAKKPMIPIKLTAVAANEDMGVMTWLLSDARAVPDNYLALELNEAKINWFNASSNYDDVVTSAADEASGQGFVTEYANDSSALSEVVWSSFDEQNWQNFKSTPHGSFGELFNQSWWQYGAFDGFWDAVRGTVTLPETISFADFQLCPDCYSANLEFSPSAYVASLETNVIDPVRDVQELIRAHSYVTRLYTTMSASEMTVDPLFTFNPDLPSVSNIHSAERVIECNASIWQSEAPWRIELPQGGVIRGTADQVGTWPAETAEQPSNLRIVRMSESGTGAVLQDNSERIDSMLGVYNESMPPPRANTSGGCAVTTGGSGSTHWPAALLAAAALASSRLRRRASA